MHTNDFLIIIILYASFFLFFMLLLFVVVDFFFFFFLTFISFHFCRGFIDYFLDFFLMCCWMLFLMHILSPSSFSCRMSPPSLLFIVHSPTHSPTDQASSTPATNTMMTVFAEDLTLFRALSLLSFLSLLFCDPPSCPLSYFFLHSFLASFLASLSSCSLSINPILYFEVVIIIVYVPHLSIPMFTPHFIPWCSLLLLLLFSVHFTSSLDDDHRRIAPCCTLPSLLSLENLRRRSIEWVRRQSFLGCSSS